MDFSEINWDINAAGAWPLQIKIAAGILVCSLIMGGSYYQFTSDKILELEGAEQSVTDALVTYKISWGKALNLELYQANYKKIELALAEMMTLIPTDAEVDILLEDISKAGISNGLTFALFKPTGEIKQEDIIELPNTINILGDYAQLGSFISDLAVLPRIVTLKNIEISPKAFKSKKGLRVKPGTRLMMKAVLTTYQEIIANKEEDNDVLDNKAMVCLEHDGLVVKGCKLKSTIHIVYPELKQRLKESRSGAFKRKLKAVKEMQAVDIYEFKPEGLRSPFVETDNNDINMPEKLAISNGIKPDFNRKKEPLEAYSLDTLRMVGTVKLKDVLWGLIRINDGTIYRVKHGNYLGKHYGHIEAVLDNKIEIKEIIKESEGLWTPHQTAIALSE